MIIAMINMTMQQQTVFVKPLEIYWVLGNIIYTDFWTLDEGYIAMDILPKSSISYNAERLSHPPRITFFPFWSHIKFLSFSSISPYWQLIEGEYDFAEGFFLFIKHCSLCQSIFFRFLFKFCFFMVYSGATFKMVVGSSACESRQAGSHHRSSVKVKVWPATGPAL